MPHLWAPMNAQPPADYVAFVTGGLTELRADAARLVGERDAPHIYPETLSDLARHWSRLRRRQRPGRPDLAAAFLRRRLQSRAAQWRDDTGYPVEVRRISTYDPARYEHRTSGYAAPPPDSVARRMAALMPPTRRSGLGEVAEAEIAWVHAYQRYCWVRVMRHITGVTLAVGGIVQVMSRLSGTG